MMLFTSELTHASPSILHQQQHACRQSRHGCLNLLLQGTYDVKFLVDGQWRLAPGWPTATTASGDTNNVLTVE